MSECRVPGKVSCENVPRRCKLLADEPKPEQPSPHRVFRILNLLRFRTRGFHHLRHLAEGEAKLYVALKLSCVEPVLLAVRRPWATVVFYCFVIAFFIAADLGLRRASQTDAHL